MGTEHAPVSQPQVTPAAPSRDLDHDEAQHDGPTDVALTSWKKDDKKNAAPTTGELEGKKKEGSDATKQAVKASLDAIAGRLDQAATRINMIIDTPFGPEGPGEHVKLIEAEIDSACRIHGFEVVARHNIKLNKDDMRQLASSEARLDAAIQSAKSYAKSNGQQIDTRPFIGVQSELGRLIGPVAVRAQMKGKAAQSSSTETLRATAIIEHLEAALARVQFLRIGIDSAKPEDLHTSIEEYTAHHNSAARIANDILTDRGKGKSGLSRVVRKQKETVLKALVSEVGALLSGTKGNPNVKHQTKWTDIASKLNATKALVVKL